MLRKTDIIGFSALLVLSSEVTYAQNLVPNPSFEIYTTCPTAEGQITNAPSWMSPTVGTPDFFHPCTGSSCAYAPPYICVPINIQGTQYARTGNGYAGIFGSWDGVTNYKEYMQVQLISPLISGQYYLVSFYVSLGDSSQYGMNSFGIYLSNNDISRTDMQGFTCCNAQINSTIDLTDTSGWTLISACFTATGGEQYITIGNFKTDASTNFTPMTPGTQQYCYYYIDDVSIVPYQNSFSLGNDTILCQGNNLILDATASNTTYLWQDNSTNATLTVSQSGTYWVRVTNNCGTASDTIVVTYNSAPTINLGNDTALCQGNDLVLDATAINATYLWQDNSTNATLTVSQSGIYWVQVTINCGTISDTIAVTYNSVPTVNLGNDTLLCQDENLILDATVSNATYLWQDNSTNPTFTITQAGDYWLQVTNDCGSLSDFIQIDYNYPPSINLGNDTLFCNGETIILDATSATASFLWQDNSTNPTYFVSQAGIYWVQANNDCGTVSDTIQIGFEVLNTLNFGNDISLCEGEIKILDASFTNASSYLWQDNSSNPTYTISQVGTYWVQATNNCGTTGDTIQVNYRQSPNIDLGNDTALCLGQTFTVDVTTPDASYQWQDNSANPIYTFSKEGDYWVSVANNCGTTSDTLKVKPETWNCDCFILAPNSFTPNNDGVNDKFYFIVNCTISKFEWSIFNRWGEKIFETSDVNDSWDGKDKGKILPQGIYVYSVSYKFDGHYSEAIMPGFIALID